MRISACVIAKNEEENLPSWLDCMQRIADEMVVVDTGSGDRTAEIARAAGAKVFFFQWMDDFAAAKNYALDRATGDWFFFLDADEYFLAEDCHKAHELAGSYDKDPNVLGIVFPRVNIDKATGRDLGSSSYVIRCFRNRRTLRYHGRIHEELKEEDGGSEKRMQQVPGPVIYHTGYSPCLMEGKLRQTVRLLELSRAEDGARPADDLHFLDCYYGLGDYEKAILHARKAIEGGVGFLSMMNRPRSLLILSLMKAKHPPGEVREALEEAIARYPSVAEYWIFWGMLDWERRDFLAAETHFRKGVERCTAPREPDVLVTDHAASMLPFAFCCLGKIAFWKKRLLEAEEHLARSLQGGEIPAGSLEAAVQDTGKGFCGGACPMAPWPVPGGRRCRISGKDPFGHTLAGRSVGFRGKAQHGSGCL